MSCRAISSEGTVAVLLQWGIVEVHLLNSLHFYSFFSCLFAVALLRNFQVEVYAAAKKWLDGLAFVTKVGHFHFV